MSKIMLKCLTYISGRLLYKKFYDNRIVFKSYTIVSQEWEKELVYIFVTSKFEYKTDLKICLFVHVSVYKAKRHFQFKNDFEQKKNRFSVFFLKI